MAGSPGHVVPQVTSHQEGERAVRVRGRWSWVVPAPGKELSGGGLAVRGVRAWGRGWRVPHEICLPGGIRRGVERRTEPALC